MRARYYDPASGRFLSRDPVWPRPDDPLSLNPYQYAVNNPLLHIDPTGLLDGPLPQVALEASIQSVERSILRQLGITFPRVPGLLRADQSVLLGYVVPMILIMQQFYLIQPEILNEELLRIRLQQENLARYNQLTQVLKSNPFAFLGLLGVARSYDPAGSFLVHPALAAVPNAALYASVELGAIVRLGQSLRAQTDAVERYAAGLRQPHVQAFADLVPIAIQQLVFGQVIIPPREFPRGVAFVNGQLVTPKLLDLVHGIFEREKLYEDLADDGITPEELVDDLLDRLGVGGSSYDYEAY
jgi:hypothetical protein